MTYFEFLIRFLILPLIVLLAITVLEKRQSFHLNGSPASRSVWIAIGLHVLLAVVYTTPWDNYLVATNVWSYNRHLVSGLVLGWVPIEEYLFFVLETLLTGLWWWFLSRRVAPPPEFRPSKSIRVLALLFAGVLWLGSVFILALGWRPGTYLALILVWALPAIAPQLAFGADILWQRRKLVALTILPMFIYLSAADSLAIASGTWAIDPAQTTGIFIGMLPIEEALFFAITVFLIGFGLTLALSPLTQARWRAWLAQMPWLSALSRER
jgi:lycopene cyclase domain-containing protein